MVSINARKASGLLLFLCGSGFSMNNESDKPSASESKINVGIIKVTDDNRQQLIKMAMSVYESEGCGICKKPGADVFWFNPHSRCAHKVCFDLIKNAEKDLYTNLSFFFKEKDDHGKGNMAHVAAVEGVEKEIRKEGIATIKEYIDKHGETRLKALFDGVGLQAVIQYKAKKSHY